jgi:hypothetical protein
MGVQVEFANVLAGLGDTAAKQALIPSFNDSHPGDKIQVKDPGACLPKKVSVTYDTQFSCLATDTSDLHKICDLARSMLPNFATTPPSDQCNQRHRFG